MRAGTQRAEGRVREERDGKNALVKKVLTARQHNVSTKQILNATAIDDPGTCAFTRSPYNSMPIVKRLALKFAPCISIKVILR